jgi:hypothetical protein
MTADDSHPRIADEQSRNPKDLRRPTRGTNLTFEMQAEGEHGRKPFVSGTGQKKKPPPIHGGFGSG